MLYTAIVERRPSGSYSAHVPQLEDARTQAEDLDELMEKLREVIKLRLENRPEMSEPDHFLVLYQVSLNEPWAKF